MFVEGGGVTFVKDVGMFFEGGGEKELAPGGPMGEMSCGLLGVVISEINLCF